MLSRKNLVISTLFAVVTAIGGCSSSASSPSAPPKPDGGTADGGGGAARPKTKPKTTTLKAKAGSTPPAGAKSLGAQTKPKAGAVTVPITNVEVFTFEESFGEGSPPETINWAYVEGTGTYLWASGPVTCEDGSTDPAAAFLMEVKPDGTGTYLFSLPGCPSGDLFGCEFDAAGNDTTCGACIVQDADLVCAVSQ
jgi:hypothetical protein